MTPDELGAVPGDPGDLAADTVVSRETPEPAIPPAPETVRVRYPAVVEALERYAALLATDGVTRGLLGPREVPRLWDRHLLNCLAVEVLVPAGARVADVGSGAGLPGLVLAIARPDLSVTLVEPMLRRATFLEEAVGALGLTNVVVRRARAEQLDSTERFDVVTSRAVAPLDRLAAWCAPLLASEGLMLAMKGDRAEAELSEFAGPLARLRLGSGRIVRVGEDLMSPPTTVIEVRGPTRALPSKPKARSTGRRTR